MRNLIITIVLLLLISCELLPSREEARVIQKEGIYIYILSQPQMQYRVIGNVKNDLINQINEATKGKKKFGRILEGIAGTAAKNTDFNSLLNRMIEITQENHPNAEGLIFENNMSNATVISFSN